MSEQRSLFVQSIVEKAANTALALHIKRCQTCKNFGVWSCPEHEKLAARLREVTANPPWARE